MALPNFQADLERGRKAEELVLRVFSQLTNKYIFKDVASDRSYFHKGDIVAYEPERRREIYIEVKDDTRIADTGKILCEEEVFYHQSDYSVMGNMYNNDTDIYVIVSRPENKIYVIDFKVLQANYRKGDFMVIPHTAQTSYVYLLELCRLKQFGGLIATIDISNI